MMPFFVSIKNKKEAQIILLERRRKHEIELLLTGQYIKSPFLLQGQKQFNLDKNKILKGLGIKIQTIRQEDPRLVNHSIIKNFLFIYKIENPNEKLIIAKRFHEIYGVSIKDVLNLPAEWFDQMFFDSDNQINEKKIFEIWKKYQKFINSHHITSSIQLNDKLESEGKKIIGGIENFIKPCETSNCGDIQTILSGKKEEGFESVKIKNYDFKNGQTLVYPSYEEQPQKILQDINNSLKNKKNECFGLIETPKILHPSELEEIEKNLKKKFPTFMENIEFLNPNQSPLEKKLVENSEGCDVNKIIKNQAKFIQDKLKTNPKYWELYFERKKKC
jgi:hypothetical protein